MASSVLPPRHSAPPTRAPTTAVITCSPSTRTRSCCGTPNFPVGAHSQKRAPRTRRKHPKDFLHSTCPDCLCQRNSSSMLSRARKIDSVPSSASAPLSEAGVMLRVAAPTPTPPRPNPYSIGFGQGLLRLMEFSGLLNSDMAQVQASAATLNNAIQVIDVF